MQLTAAILLAFSLSLSAKSVSQTINFSARDVPVQRVFDEIRQQTGYFVLAKKEALRNIGKVTVDAKNIELAELLKIILKGKPYEFEVDKKTVFIKSKVSESVKVVSPVIEIPPITVKGRILNEKGEPVAASVVIKGTNRGVITDNYGNFELSDVDGNAVLVVSGINIETQEVKVNGKSEININAITKVTAEEEVVYNGGYYKTTDKKRTGNIAKVTAKDIERQPVTSPLLAVQGRVTGVDVVQQNGFPGTAPKIQIRGQNSIRLDGNYPLYVIDGVPMDSRPLVTGSVTGLFDSGFDPFSTINPANIQSIEILKDADATAIYGSRGANGVILVTTKSGNKTGTTNVQFDIYKGFGKIVNKAELMNRKQYLEMRNEAFQNGGTIPGAYDFDVNGVWDTTRETNWQDVLLGGTAQITNLQTNISWSSGGTSFRLGGGFAEQTTIYPGDFGFRNITGNFSMNHQSVNKKFNILFSSNYGTNRNKLFDDANFINKVLLSPVAPALYDSNGQINWAPGADGFTTFFDNPLSLLLNNGEQRQSSLNVSANLGYFILPGVALKLNMGYIDTRGTEIYVYPIASTAPENRPYQMGSSKFSNTSRQTWNIEPQLTITKTIGNHHLNAIIGGAFQQSVSVFQSVNGQGYTSDALLGSLRGAQTTEFMADNNVLYKYVSALGRIEYDYKGKYLLNISGRRDGSSRFGPGKQFGSFGSIGSGWIFSEENFIKNSVGFLSFGKLRGSYGVTGNDQIPDYAYLDSYSPTVPYNGLIGLGPTALFNPNFAWEETKKLEVGLQFGLFADRLMAEISWYRNRTSNQLIQYPLPFTAGFDQFTAFNFPALIQNNGSEYQLKLDIVRKKDITWTTTFNLSIPKNKLVAFDGIESSPYATLYKVGEPLSVKRLYTYIGVDSISGLYKVLDVNGDGFMSDEDRQFKNVGKRDYYGGINNTIRIKNFELSFLFRFVKQDRFVERNGSAGFNRYNQFADYPAQRWTTSKHQATHQKYSTGFDALIAYADYTGSDGVYSDASFWRLQNLSLSYNIPFSMQRKFRLSDAKLFIQGQNLLTITPFKTGFDPETGMVLPPLRMLSFGASLKF